MGAWGRDPFDDDSALDWLIGVENREPEEAIRGAFEAALQLDYVDVDEGSAAVAAAAIVASAMRGAALSQPGAMRMANALRPSTVLAELRELGVRALDIVIGERSELSRLWADGSGPSLWHQETRALRDTIASG